MTKPSVTEHRTFLLTLDADDGQGIAEKEGFTRPSQEVQERETQQVYKDWALLDAEGVLPNLMTYANWFADVVMPDGASVEDRMHTTRSLITFAATALVRLKHTGMLETPPNRRLVPIIQDLQGNLIDDDSIPEELMEHAAEMYEWRNGGNR